LSDSQNRLRPVFFVEPQTKKKRDGEPVGVIIGMTQAFNSSPLARKLVGAILFAPWDPVGAKNGKAANKKVVLILGFGKESCARGSLRRRGIKAARAPAPHLNRRATTLGEWRLRLRRTANTDSGTIC